MLQPMIFFHEADAGSILLTVAGSAPRIAFLYHSLPSYAFALFALVYWLCRLWKHRHWMVVAFTTCVVATALYFLPMTIALPMNPESLRQRAWLETWLGG